MNPELIVSVVLSLASLTKEIVVNWNNDDYKPVMKEELLNAISQLEALKDLPEK